MKKIFMFTIMLAMLAMAGNAFAQTPDSDKLREALEQRLKEIELAKKYAQKDYTLDLRKVPLGELPNEWDGPDNAMVNNIDGSKCLTTNSTPVTLTITDHFNQPGDFVLNFRLMSRGETGQIVDENGNTIPFYVGAGKGLIFGNFPRGAITGSPVKMCSFTITRRGNVLSMVNSTNPENVVPVRSDNFKSLTGFSITIPRSGGLFAFSVRSLDAEKTGAGPRRSGVPGSVGP